MEKTLHKQTAFACAFFINLLLWYVIFSFYQQFKSSPILIDPFKNKQEPVVSFQQQPPPTTQPISQQKTVPVQQIVHDELHETHLEESEPLDPIPSTQTERGETRQRPTEQPLSQQQAESQGDNQEEQSGSRRVTREQFSQALRNALQAPPESEKNQWGNASTNGGSSLPDYIQTRIRDDLHLRYDSKVNKVLKEAFAIAGKTLFCNKKVDKRVVFSVSIDRLGRPVDVRLPEGTTMPACDAYIINVIKSCTFAPLPARFTGNTYQFEHQAQFHSRIGSNLFEYVSLFD